MAMTLLVDQQRQLEEVAQRLRGGLTYHIDTEFDSRATRTTLCLVQLLVEGEVILIDAVALHDLSLLARTVGATESTWVLHGGHQDIPLLCRALNIDVPPKLFDTQIARGLCSAEAATSFAYLNYVLLGVRGSKQHQTDDWLKRPLTHSQLEYAAHDVETLPLLCERLTEQLSQLGRNSIVHEACREMLIGTADDPEPLSLESFRNAWQLDPPGQAALVSLIEWYNAFSPRERHQAPEPKLFWSIANRLPRSIETLHQVRGLPRSLTASHQQAILAMTRAAAQGNSKDKGNLEPPPYQTFARLQLDAWLEYVRCTACARARVAREVVLAGSRYRRLRDQVEKLSLAAFDIERLAPVIGGWQCELVGESLRAAAHEIPPPSSLTV